MKTINTLPPFKRFCVTIGNLPSSYVDSMSYYECIMWLCKYLKDTVIPAVNENAEAVNELINWFNNLDVTEEVNAKLDEMVESGELQEIIGKYVNKFINNSYIIEDISTVEGYNETHNTHYYLTRVPANDSKGNRIRLYHGFADDNETSSLTASETARSFAKRKNATFVSNASIYNNESTSSLYKKPYGLIINNSQIVCNNGFGDMDPTYVTEHIHYLGVKEDNTLVVYPSNTSYETIVNDGCYTSFCAFEKRMENGVILTDSTELYQWNLIGQNTTTKDIYFICCNGKNINGEAGMTQPELLAILQEHGCDFAFRLDCGGSTSSIFNSVMLNQPTDDVGQSEREVPDYIYFYKEKETIYDENISELFNRLGDTKALANKTAEQVKYISEIDNNVITFKKSNVVQSQFDGLYFLYDNGNSIDSSIIFDPATNRRSLNIYDYTRGKSILTIEPLTGLIKTFAGDLATIFKINDFATDLNNVVDTSIVGATSTTQHSPDSAINWVVITLRLASIGAVQIAIPVRQNQTLTPWKCRTNSTSTHGEWYNLVTPTNP